ncbi:hypothetical protein C8J56DRAFT_1040816 [Mycena floridula]|nr:hypothetical protein C8J56DRAFT_1040816 [Mycena floridula]
MFMEKAGASPEETTTFLDAFLTINRRDEKKLDNLIAQTLDRALESKPAPLCLLAFPRAMNLFFFETSVDHNDDQARRSRYHSSYDAFINLATTYKTAEQIATIEKEWGQCRCNVNDSLVFQCHLGIPVGAGTLSFATRGIFLELSQVVTRMRNRKLDKGAGKWPLQSTQLIRNDAAEAVVASKQWLKHTFTPSRIFAFLTGLIVILPSMHTAILYDKELLALATSHLERSVRYALSPSVKSETEDIELVLGHGRCIGGSLFFFDQLLCRCGPHQFQTPLTPVARRLYAISCRLLPLLKASSTDSTLSHSETLDTVKKVAFLMYDLIPLDKRPDLHDDLTAMRIQETTDSFSFLYSTLKFFITSRTCANPGCLNTTESIGRALLQCSGCRMMLYCSTECQKVAWNHSETPHKSLCKAAKPFMAIKTAVRDARRARNENLDLGLEKMEFDREVTAAGITQQVAQKFLDQTHRLEDQLEEGKMSLQFGDAWYQERIMRQLMLLVEH